MASISRQANGRKVIQFTGADGKRKSIRLGKASLAATQSVKLKVENLVVASITGHAVDDETARWVARLNESFYEKLAAVGLVPRRESATLGPYIDAYIDGRTDTKPATRTTFKRAKKKLLGYFRADRRLRDVTPGDADDFARWLREPNGGKLSEATARKTVSIAKQIFRAALRKKLIMENPFADLSGTVPANRQRDYFVSRAEADKVLAACPDAEWRLLFALARYGGLRCPSETLALRWSDIDWGQDRMTVRSSKTEHHEGGASRTVPIFPELRPYLLAAFEQADDGAEFAITRYRNTAVNLRTQLTRIIRRAGLKPWPKLWQNLRATRETELAEAFPAHVVSAWIGNSEAVAAKHYLQVTDEHFERAAKGVGALHNAVQNTRAPVCMAENAPNDEPAPQPANADIQGDALAFNDLNCPSLGPAGLEPATSGL
jgi:integrase